MDASPQLRARLSEKLADSLAAPPPGGHAPTSLRSGRPAGQSHGHCRDPQGWQDEGEVDFLARPPTGEVELIQVCADARDPQTASRELDAEAAHRYPRATRRLLTLTRDGLPAEVADGIIAEPA